MDARKVVVKPAACDAGAVLRAVLKGDGSPQSAEKVRLRPVLRGAATIRQVNTGEEGIDACACQPDIGVVAAVGEGTGHEGGIPCAIQAHVGETARVGKQSLAVHLKSAMPEIALSALQQGWNRLCMAVFLHDHTPFVVQETALAGIDDASALHQDAAARMADDGVVAQGRGALAA